MSNLNYNNIRNYGLIGYPLSHSFSEKFFTQEFEIQGINDAQYNNYPITSIKELPKLIKETNNLLGLSVTSPYKQQVIQYLDKIHPDAEKASAVNLIKINRGATITLEGFNTDIWGFAESLKPQLTNNITSALILGTGGAARAVSIALSNLGINYLFVTRKNTDLAKKMINYNDVNHSLFSKSKLIVNATPLGMLPNVNSYPLINYTMFNATHLAFDLIYNPEKTLFLKKAEQNNARIINGLKMLNSQAKKAWKILDISNNI